MSSRLSITKKQASLYTIDSFKSKRERFYEKLRQVNENPQKSVYSTLAPVLASEITETSGIQKVVVKGENNKNPLFQGGKSNNEVTEINKGIFSKEKPSNTENTKAIVLNPNNEENGLFTKKEESSSKSQINLPEKLSVFDSNPKNSADISQKLGSVDTNQEKNSDKLLFGVTSAASLFGNSSSLFANKNTELDSKKSLFGPTSESNKSSLFAPISDTSKPTLIGSTSDSNKSGLFSQPTDANKSGLFGIISDTTKLASTSDSNKSKLFGPIIDTSKSGLHGSIPDSNKPSLFGPPADASKSISSENLKSPEGLFGKKIPEATPLPIKSSSPPENTSESSSFKGSGLFIGKDTKDLIGKGSEGATSTGFPGLNFPNASSQSPLFGGTQDQKLLFGGTFANKPMEKPAVSEKKDESLPLEIKSTDVTSASVGFSSSPLLNTMSSIPQSSLFSQNEHKSQSSLFPSTPLFGNSFKSPDQNISTPSPINALTQPNTLFGGSLSGQFTSSNPVPQNSLFSGSTQSNPFIGGSLFQNSSPNLFSMLNPDQKKNEPLFGAQNKK